MGGRKGRVSVSPATATMFAAHQMALPQHGLSGRLAISGMG